MSVSVVIRRADMSDVNAAFRALHRAGEAHAALRDLRRPLKADLSRHARAQAGPEGRWAPRARATVERARRSKDGIRVRGPRRNLLNSLPRRTVKFRLEGKRLVAYSVVKWSGIHQYGGTAGRGAKIPARPFLWISDPFYREAHGILVERLTKAWRRG